MPADLPLRSPEVEPAGRFQDMAYKEGRWLLCVGGTRYVQSTELLYRILSHADGETGLEEIAKAVSEESGRELSGDQVGWLLENRLRPAGLVLPPGGELPPGATPLADALRAPSLALGIRYRLPLLPYRLTAPVTAVLQHLYAPPVIVLAVAAALLVNLRVYTGSELLKGLRALFYTPEVMLALFGIDAVTRVFHELGHASALRRAGARYGWIGVALYVIFPVYFTDVTHAYRLSRWQRVRVDLGGIYFDLITMVVLYGLYRLTGSAPLLLMISLIGLGVLRQFTPFMRFDGYYLIADLMGVHEPLAMIGPWLKGVFGRRAEASPMRLTRGAQLLLGAYAAIIVGFFTRPVLIMGVAGGAILTELPKSGLVIWDQFQAAWLHGGGIALRASVTLELLFWILIPLGLALFVGGILRLLGQASLGGARLAYAAASARLAERRGPVPPLPAPAPPPPLAPVPLPMDALLRPVTRSETDELVEELIQAAAAAYLDGLRTLAADLRRVYELEREERRPDRDSEAS